MTIQFMFSPDGVGTVAVGTAATAAFERRGFRVPTDNVSVAGRSDGKLYYQHTNAGASYLSTLNAKGATCFGMRVWRTGTGTDNTQGVLLDGVNLGTPVYITPMSTGLLSVYSNASGTTNDINLSTPYANGDYFEFTFLGTTLNVYRNGSASPAATVTVATAFAPVGEFGLAGSGTSLVGLRDVYAATTRLGEIEVRPAPIVSASATGTLVGGTAAQAATIDTPTAYASCAPGTNVLAAVTGSISDNPQTIHAVQVTSLARKSGTALLPEKVLVTTPAGTGEIAPARPLAMGFGARTLVMETDPNDSAAWTKVKVNGLTVGGKG